MLTIRDVAEDAKYIIIETNDGGADATYVDGNEIEDLEEITGRVYSESVAGTVLRFVNEFEEKAPYIPPYEEEDPPYIPPVTPEEPEEEIIEDPEIPLAPADPAEGDEEIEEEIIEEEIPLIDLPKTGGITGIGFCVAGLGALAAGTMLKLKKEEDEE